MRCKALWSREGDNTEGARAPDFSRSARVVVVRVPPPQAPPFFFCLALPFRLLRSLGFSVTMPALHSSA
jgi:hypothetical protein